MLTLEFVNATRGCTKSCLNCVHVHAWYEPQTYWEPSDSGWECKLHLDESIEDYPDNLPFDEVALGEYYASRCSHYQKAQPSRDIAPDEF